MSKDDEQVLVCDTSVFQGIGGLFEGVNLNWLPYYKEIIEKKNCWFERRGDVEDAPARKQIIPYCILYSHGKILCYTRGKSGGEGRLHDFLTFGIGGHINPIDGEVNDYPYFKSVYRELNEELQIVCPIYHFGMMGIVNTEENMVGKVHVGFIHVFLVEDFSKINSGELAIDQVQFLTPEEIALNHYRLEYWARLCCDSLLELIPFSG